MKSIQIRYTDQFLKSPMSDWVGLPFSYWVKDKFPSGQERKLEARRTSFYVKYKVYAQVVAHLDGIDMVFATPEELDHFIEVMSQNPLPRGRQFYPGRSSPGLPNGHWLSRFPAKGKTWKFRQKAIKFLTGSQPALREFRDFYADKPVAHFDEIFDGRPYEGSGYRDDPYRPIL